jgi:hypothetical protein
MADITALGALSIVCASSMTQAPILREFLHRYLTRRAYLAVLVVCTAGIEDVEVGLIQALSHRTLGIPSSSICPTTRSGRVLK